MNGFICIDKPCGMTSFAAVARLRKLLGQKKAGHTGTLDPMATGVLTVAMGAATRFIELIPNHDKKYRASFQLGVTTDTLDITGQVLSRQRVDCSPNEVKKAAEAFSGRIKQLPPMYSAIKKDGVRLYELARQGIEIEREEREITIYSLSFIKCQSAENLYEIEVSCSAGTYIRSLVSDIGDKLGCGAVLTGLRRVKANGVDISDCFTLERLEKMDMELLKNEALIRTDEMLGFPSVTVTAAQAKRFSNGGELALDRVKRVKADGYYNVCSPEGTFLGVGEAQTSEMLLKVKKVYSGD